ncbi:MAG: dihydroneopterin aldolase [Deltaproteobacteria bacterium]|nr:dihydroneopterin aldolase [Deltaproteobacteria bacterium]
MNDVLRVVDVEVECLIGVYPEERRTPQPLKVALAFELDTRRAAQEESLAHTVDYARVVGEVTFVLQEGAFHLLETAAEVICATVLSGLEHPSEMELTLQKPRALGGNGIPSLSVKRGRDAPSALWTFGFGVVDVVWNVRGLGIYRLRLKGGAGVQLPKGVVIFDGQRGRQGEIEKPSSSSPSPLHNRGTELRTYLLLSRPPLRLDAFVAV